MGVKAGKDWARMGRIAGCTVFCTGAEADKLNSRSIYTVQPRAEEINSRWQYGRVYGWRQHWVLGVYGMIFGNLAA